jgi:glycosyltransferase involved in cell wall biosynthesis
MNTYIIPTIGRETLQRTIDSINREDPNSEKLICRGGTAGENRNKGLEQASGTWLFFIDDDDYYSPGYLSEIDQCHDIVVFRMMQHGRVIPSYENNTLQPGNVGINFAIKKSFYEKLKAKFRNFGFAEDWFFLEQYLKLNPRVKITDKIYYNAPIANHINNSS